MNYKPIQFFQAKGLNNRSRGQRPRSRGNNNFCPVRAIQNLSCSQANAAITSHLERAHCLFHKRTSSVADAGNPSKSLVLSIACPSKFGMQFNHHRWSCRSRPHFVQPDQEISNGKSHGNSQKRFFQIRKDIEFKSPRLSLAGWLWTFQRQSIAFGSSKKIYSQSGRTPQNRNISGRVFANLEKISRAIRRTVFVGLKLSGLPFQGEFSTETNTEGVALGYNGTGRWPASSRKILLETGTVHQREIISRKFQTKDLSRRNRKQRSRSRGDNNFCSVRTIQKPHHNL